VSTTVARWPPLPTTGFVSGRSATKAEFESGAALFYLEFGGRPVGLPIAVDIPQYAFLKDDATGELVPVVLLQAESNGVRSIVGCREIEGGGIRVAALHELELLGSSSSSLPPPNTSLERTREG
jgi:hypothetical protein